MLAVGMGNTRPKKYLGVATSYFASAWRPTITVGVVTTFRKFPVLLVVTDVTLAIVEVTDQQSPVYCYAGHSLWSY